MSFIVSLSYCESYKFMNVQDWKKSQTVEKEREIRIVRNMFNTVYQNCKHLTALEQFKFK